MAGAGHGTGSQTDGSTSSGEPYVGVAREHGQGGRLSSRVTTTITAAVCMTHVTLGQIHLPTGLRCDSPGHRHAYSISAPEVVATRCHSCIPRMRLYVLM